MGTVFPFKAPIGICKPTQHKARVGREGGQIMLLLDGKLTELTVEAAKMLGRALITKALEEEEERAALGGQLVMDEAILLRAGAPISLTHHPKIRAEAEKEAVSNRDLRRYMPGGVKSEEHVPGPVVRIVPGTAPAERK